MNEKKEKVLIGMVCLFAGMVVGFLIAPVKGGIIVVVKNEELSPQEELM